MGGSMAAAPIKDEVLYNRDIFCLSIRLFVRTSHLAIQPEAWLAGPQIWLAEPHIWLAGPQAWLDGPERGRMDRRTDERKISPFYKTLSPIEAAALLSPLKPRKCLFKIKVKQGKGTTDHLMPLGYLFCAVFGNFQQSTNIPDSPTMLGQHVMTQIF